MGTNNSNQSLNKQSIQETLITVLKDVLPSHPQIKYRLVGTGAALLHGVKVPAADVDILVKNRTDVENFNECLVKYQCLSSPSFISMTRQYYSNYYVNGIELGISTVEIDSEIDTIETFGRGPWQHFTSIQCGPYRVPTINLELRLITELYRNRPNRYQPIIQHMKINSCDLDLLRRALNTDRPDFPKLSEAVKEDVLIQIKGKISK